MKNFGFDLARAFGASKMRFGNVRARGLPAILLGIAGIVLASGAMRALQAGAPNLPDTIREMRQLLEARRTKPLNP